MVIGLVTAGFDRGGLEQIIFDLYRGYRKAGVKAYILCQQRQPNAYFVSRLHSEDHICFFEDSFERFIAFCYQKGITHLHYHHNVSYMEQAKACGIETAYTIHNAYTWFDDVAMEQWSAKVGTCDHIIAVSSFVRDYFCARSGIPLERVTVVSNGVDLEDIQKPLCLPGKLTRAGLGIQPGDVVFSQIAAYSALKYPLGLVGVMERVVRQCPNAKLLLAGHILEDDYYQMLHGELDASPARDNILLLDYIPHEYIGAFLRQTVDVSVLASLQEGFGNVIVEAMACQTPLILNRTGYAADLQSPGALVVDPPYQKLHTLSIQELVEIARSKECGNTQALADAFIYATEHLDDLKGMVADWPQKAERMSVQTMADSYLDVLGHGEELPAEPQARFFAQTLCQTLPPFLKSELEDNAWTVAVNGDVEPLTQQFPRCRFVSCDADQEALPAADVTMLFGPARSLSDPQGMMTRLCQAAKKYVVLLLPVGESSAQGSKLTLEGIPLRQGDFYMESSALIDGISLPESMWPGNLLLVVYTAQSYRPDTLTLQDIHQRFTGPKDQNIALLNEQHDAQQKASKEQAERISALSQTAQTLKTQLQQAEAQSQVRIQELEAQSQTQARELAEREAQAADLEAQIVRLQQENDQSQKEARDCRRALGMAEAELTLKREAFETHQKLILENQLTLLDAHATIFKVQHSKVYRIALFLRRIKAQLIQGPWAERKDFVRWCWGKLRGKIVGRPLQEFDEMAAPLQRMLWRSEEDSQVIQSTRGLNIEGVIAKSSRQIYIFAGVAYYDVGGGQRSAQLANAFDSMGYEVHYIYGFDSAESKRETMYLPVLQHVHIDNYSLQDLAETIQPDAVFIFETPYSKFIPYLDYANAHGYVTVYEHIDNWDSSLGSAFFNREDFQHFIDTVGHITVTARVLGEKIQEVGRQEYLYSANAVDSSLFEPARSYEKPADLVAGRRTLLYFGSLWGEWFDWDMILYVANHVDCSINLIGDYAFMVDKLPTMPDNVHFLGLKKHEELPAYLAYCDFTLLPFKKSVIGKYVSPLKVFEYIAMNKPVLATPLDDIMGYPNTVLSEDPEVWAQAVRDGVSLQDSTIFTAENSWYARCNQLLDLVGRQERHYPSISVVILNRNNMNVIFRCVSSLLTFSSAYDMEIIVVDNDSTDGSYERLGEEYGDKIKLVKNSKNGCSSGRNLGAQAATGELLLFLDSDQWVTSEHYIDAALDLLLADSQIGAVGWAAGWFDPGSYLGPIAANIPNHGIMAPWVLCRTDIAYLGSGGMILRRALFEEIGGFDEFYDPTCFEDTDLSLKIRHAGYELAYCPYMNIMHLPHQTTQSGSSTHAAQMERNSKYFGEKWKALDASLLDRPLR